MGFRHNLCRDPRPTKYPGHGDPECYTASHHCSSLFRRRQAPQINQTRCAHMIPPCLCNLFDIVPVHDIRNDQFADILPPQLIVLA